MKKFLILVISGLIITSVMLTGCGNNVENNVENGVENNIQNGVEDNSEKSDEQGIKRLTNCLALTKEVDSLEANLISESKANGQSSTSKMNMKFEGIKSSLKCLATFEIAGQTQEYYMTKDNGKIKMYLKDQSGKYTVNEIDQAQAGNSDINESFNAYIDIIENNPDMISKIDGNTYELDIPKEKSSEIYSKIAGNGVSMNFETLKINFVVGDDGYLKSMILKAKSESVDIDSKTDYFNYNKKFNIVLPEV
ncbi:MAG TPA: hypothetical protein PK566_00480 [Pseudobacteroides sp.]|nr:hypothetical protein [Pseudobacteroides sp.]